MRRAATVPAMFFLASACLGARLPAAETRVAFELLLEDPYAQASAKQWHELISPLPDVSVRIRSGRAGERSGIEEVKGADGAVRSYRVIGILTPNNRLDLPGASFSVRDRAKLEAWLRKLRGGGEEGLRTPTMAFGLTAKQLTQVHDELKQVVSQSTKGLTVAEAVRRIATDAGLQLESDTDARGGANEPVDNELKGLSTGSALAAALRPGGLVLTLSPPERPTDHVRLRIRKAESAEEFWPIGWPLQGAASRFAPEMYKRLDVEINGAPLNDALDAIRPRLSTPLLLDHNAMVREGIDPATTKVSHPAGNSYYRRIIDRMLSSAKLTGKLRQDEAGTVFYWITTRKQAISEGKD
ncbi:MAG: hypothetical protein KDB14_04245 [Planctomycetales bacterium]|nr:hypothetical protein [Planctomycetales bacterium]